MSLLQYCRVFNNENIVDFNGANNTGSLNFKEKMKGQRYKHGTKNVEIVVSLKYFSKV